MNYFITLILLLMSFSTFSANKKNKIKEYKFTEEQLKKEVSKRLLAKISEIKNKGSVNFSNELMEKEQKLNLKEVALKTEYKKFESSKLDFIRKISVFKEKENKLIGCLDKIDQKRNERISHMVNTVAAMKPVNAANLLSVQESELSVQILGQLPATKVSKIFNLMKKEISARLQKQYLNMQK